MEYFCINVQLYNVLLCLIHIFSSIFPYLITERRNVWTDGRRNNALFITRLIISHFLSNFSIPLLKEFKYLLAIDRHGSKPKAVHRL